MGKSTISMAIFHCYVSSPEGNHDSISMHSPENRPETKVFQPRNSSVFLSIFPSSSGNGQLGFSHPAWKGRNGWTHMDPQYFQYLFPVQSHSGCAMVVTCCDWHDGQTIPVKDRVRMLLIMYVYGMFKATSQTKVMEYIWKIRVFCWVWCWDFREEEMIGMFAWK